MELNERNEPYPLTFLEKGIKVVVSGTKYGRIVKTNKNKDLFGMPINSFTVRYEKKYAYRVGNKNIYKPFDKTETVAYTGIRVFDWKD